MWILGLDTSNYTTSAALLNPETGELRQSRYPLPVPPGRVGLRQSDAVFHHVKRLGGLLDDFLRGLEDGVAAVGVSDRPRDAEGSYMPCFLAGEMAAQVISGALSVPLRRFSHQAGHIAAALFGVGAMSFVERTFLAFHASGGTTECLLVNPAPGGRIFDVRILGRTLDLNAGQVIDRVGAALGLAFPAGPALEELAGNTQSRHTIKPVLKGLDCCLSGLENRCSAMLERGEDRESVAAYCQAFVARTILEMAVEARRLHPGLPIVFAGGVMSNEYIRDVIRGRMEALFAPPGLSADNAAGIAALCSIPEKEGRIC